MKKYLVIFSVIALALLIGCNNKDEDLIIIESQEPISQTVLIDSSLGFVVKVHDNTLCFDSASDVITALNVLYKLPKDERRAWEKTVGFTSVLTQIEDLKEKIELIEDQDEFRQLIQENQELVIEDSTECYNIKPRVYGYYPAITGKNGMFVSENIWCKVFDGKLYSTHTFDRTGYLEMCKLHECKTFSDTLVKSIIVDFNWEDPRLKSYHSDKTVTDTYIELELYNYGSHNPTKKAIYKMELINNYATRSVCSMDTYTQYFLKVYYDGSCSYCHPNNYTISYAGRTYRFYRDAYGDWRINLPYEGYLDDYPFQYPNWDDEFLGSQSYVTNVWYTYYGGIDLSCSFEAHKRGIGANNWRPSIWDGTIVWFHDVSAEVQVGMNQYGNSTVKNVSKTDINGNYEKKYENGVAEDYRTVYSLPLAKYKNRPPAVFKGCVSGYLGARFCPVEYHFEFTF